MTDGVAVLPSDGLITLDEVAQHGMRIRAAAGTGSLPRRPKLVAALAQQEAADTNLR